MRAYVVYCPAVGYRLDNDTGRRFALASEAWYFVMRLRKNGHHAWLELE